MKVTGQHVSTVLFKNNRLCNVIGVSKAYAKFRIPIGMDVT